LPHVWLFRNGEQVSSLDLVKTGHFGLITGIGGEAWEVAAQRAAEIFGIDLDVSVIGPGCALEDLFGDWSAICEIDEDGCLLIRPDRHIAWRCHHVVDAGSSVQLLSEALGSVLGVDKPHAISTI
jgi:2,4-dichlorophenol 6-monooxygenase